MDDILRFRATRAFNIGKRTIPRDSLIPLKLIFDILHDLLALGLIQEIEQDGESKWVALLVDYESYIKGEIIEKSDLPNWNQLKQRGWAIELYDRDLSSEHVCGGCPKGFITWEAAIRHRKMTGHKRPYKKKMKAIEIQEQ